MKMEISRRSFIWGSVGSAAMGLCGCAGLPFAGGLRKDDTLVALLADCHVGNWHSPKYQGEKFVACLARVLALDPLPGKMFILGDLAYLWGRKEDYALSRRLLQPALDAGIDVTIGMGNHDRRENFLEYWPACADRSPVPGRIVSRVRGVHFDYILLDSLNQPKATDKWITPGVLDDAQREWLRGECRAAKRPFLVMAHHPACELKLGDDIMGKKGETTKCGGFIHGHDHFWYVTHDLKRWSEPRIGLTACLPSTGHWGDIGYALLRERPDRAELSLVQYDYFTPAPPRPDAAPRADWQAIIRDHQDARCTFVSI